MSEFVKLYQEGIGSEICPWPQRAYSMPFGPFLDVVMQRETVQRAKPGAMEDNGQGVPLRCLNHLETT